MRFADNFNPEWGYLAPAPSFMHMARVAIVAAAVGATSGAAVVYLIDRLFRRRGNLDRCAYFGATG